MSLLFQAIFKGSVQRKTLAFFQGFKGCFSKKQEGSGFISLEPLLSLQFRTTVYRPLELAIVLSNCKKGFWKRGNCVNFGFLALTFLSSSYLWRLFGHLCSNVTPETDPCWATEGPKTQPLRKFVENFRQMRKLSEIVFLTSWTSNTVKQGLRKMSEMSEIWPPIFCGPPEVQSALQTPLCTALSSFQFSSLGFSCLVAHWHHNSQRFEPSISLPNSHGPFAHNQAIVK